MEKFQSYSIKTSRGVEKWSAIDKIASYGETYYLMENDKYGDEVPYIIMNSRGHVEEWDWYDTLADWLNN